MNFNNFTIKSQEAVQQAVNVTQARGQQAIEPVHLLAGVLKVGENVTHDSATEIRYGCIGKNFNPTLDNVRITGIQTQQFITKKISSTSQCKGKCKG